MRERREMDLEGKKQLIEYTLLKSTVSNEDENIVECYDLKLTMGKWKAEFKDIAREEILAKRIFSLMTREEVDPISAPYIMEELLARTEYLERSL